MQEFITHLFRAQVYLLLMAAGYYLLMRNHPAPSFNRIFILLSFAVSLLLAMLPVIPLASSASTAANGVAMMLPELIVRAGEGSSQVTGAISGTWDRMALLRLIVLMISGMLVLFTCIKLLRIVRLIRSGQVLDKRPLRLVLMQNGVSPFSFFRYVFVPSSLLDQPHFARVLAHERAHYRCGHSWDMLFMEGMRVLFWFNPAFYVLRTELKAQHEFEADRQACRVIPKADYQTTLLDFTITGTLVPLTNPFNVSLIKKRIMMMNQKTKQSTAASWLKILPLIPFLLLAVAVQSCQDQAKEEVQAETTFEEADLQSSYQEDVIFTVVETPPAFAGGEEARISFLQENLRYPDQAREAGAQGTVFVSFVVRSDGSIYDVKVLRGAGHGVEVDYDGNEEDLKALRLAYEKLNEEAMRVISNMPLWTPGYQRGQAVSVQFNMPIRFTLN